MNDLKNKGWVRFYRKSIDSSVWVNPIIWMVWSWCLLKANHQTKKFPFNGNDILVEEGSFITGIERAIKELPLTRQNYRTAIKYLQKSERLTIKSTNKFTLIIINKWQEYQLDNTQSNKPLTNEQQTTNKPLTTNKNDKNDKNENNIILSEHSSQISPLIKEFEEINPTIKYNNKTQRKACEELISKFGYEKVVATLNYYKSIRGEKFSPVITTPYELQQKMGQLLTFYNKSTNKPKTIIL
jgi:hypothetical protein